MYSSCFRHTRDRILLLNASKHEISVARQRYRLGTTHFATLKSLIQWYFDKKQSSEEPPSYFELHITFSERSLQKVTQYSRNTTPVDTDLVTATGTAAISILRLGQLYGKSLAQFSPTHFRITGSYDLNLSSAANIPIQRTRGERASAWRHTFLIFSARTRL